MSGSEIEQTKTRHRSLTHHNQLNLECAMLFCDLVLIQLQKSRSAGYDATSASDLESEFQDNLEDVFRSCSSSESWLSLDEMALSPTHSLNEPNYEW